ncbi:astrocytic phosphoprotein PEA-15-like isoform X2 [Acanthaster planci]|nr:astrocytic phosphoprotein PEA-15-like isoform X2 [Acanthaster planci]XP_022104094.1 astrocytic phosphoprotein PEA-15-like isoform X2 [Acanthaster planci]XP_022104095.1 astrocytic phosphoprotein PEA-15-like isoform X2 [Acanthaster planci]XP_022104096.1 astrocytic phosphoprotein PEA-15-like isoform X2 [Acanthaster planci]XP_022104097.1 astrocytic phosphoprotein PEA-15-like isoform X2 [Acanthaster planci]
MGESFHNFLKQLGENISEEELRSLAAACQDVIPNEERGRIHKQRELFEYMEKMGKLSADDLSYLEHALEKICRPDLVTLVLEYKQSVPDKQTKNKEISGPARKYKAMNEETGQVPDDVISGLAKLELAPPPTHKRKDAR